MAVIDLSQLPAPQIVDVPDFETLLAERKAEFVALHPKDEQEAVIRTLELESEPVTKLLQENAYRELLLRQRINEAAQAVMVAYAMGSDLDQLAANYNVKRLTVTPADNDAVPPVAAVMESDEALRLRVPAAFEGLSVAGPTAAYEFHARSADGRVADASATSPAPAEVVLTVLSREGDGTAEKGLLDVVEKALNSENVRPVADRLTVRSAEIIPYRVEATIFLYPGPEAEPVMAAAKASLQKYIASQTRLGRDIRRSAIFAALHVEGVQRVDPNFATTMLNALAGKQPLDNTLTNLSGKDVAGLLTYLGLGEAAKMPAATALASSAGNITIPVLIGGVQRTALLQWKTLSVPQSTDGNMVVVDGSWPVAFPNACLSINPSLVNSVIYATNGAPFVSAAIVDRVKFKAACAYTKSNSTVAVWGVGY